MGKKRDPLEEQVECGYCCWPRDDADLIVRLLRDVYRLGLRKSAKIARKTAPHTSGTANGEMVKLADLLRKMSRES